MGNDLAMVLILSLAITLVAYGTFPLLFALLQKGTTTAKEYRIICYIVNLLIMFAFVIINGASSPGSAPSSAAPYVIWTSAFAAIGTGILKKRKIIPTEEVSAPPAPVVEPGMIKFKCSKCQSLFTGGNTVCPNCKAAGTIKRGTKEEILLWNSPKEAVPAEKAAAMPETSAQPVLSDEEDMTVCYKCGMMVPSKYAICPRCGTEIVHF